MPTNYKAMRKGYAIPIAWPETFCKQAGSWYDGALRIVGACKNGYYKVGHAAIVLVDAETGDASYFDFGRYHTPPGFGRVRSASTDHDLKINSLVHFTVRGEPMIDGVLKELRDNPSCHGDGQLRAGIIEVDYSLAFNHIKEIQAKGIIAYGPFIYNGTNCSRFVRDIVLKSVTKKHTKLQLSFPWMLTPSPIWNVKVVGEYNLEEVLINQTIPAESYEIA